MDLICTNCWPRAKSCTLHLHTAFRFLDRGLSCSKGTSLRISTRICCNKNKKYSRKGKTQEKDENLFPVEEIPIQDVGPDSPSSGTAYIQHENKIFSSNTMEIETKFIIPSRNDVLRACTVTCGLIGALGVLIRKISHVASAEGWPLNDCSENIRFGFELWHLELVVGSVLLVSSTRFLLLKIWPDFAKSSETANRQVLTSLEPLDYLAVAFLPGISEELLFRGALLPLFGINWTSILAVATLFGILHLGGGRNYSFAVWATFVGLVYGYATILTSSAVVPMASHSLNNLVGGIIWRYQKRLEESS
ncbi:uncharacterized protein [Primulina huaijiensis]|uniref:uncharacterized protein isoform X2 n=1 Tax=Primulina huaijiensis TaxID=1492673 RepID=UPI003CC7310A